MAYISKSVWRMVQLREAATLNTPLSWKKKKTLIFKVIKWLNDVYDSLHCPFIAKKQISAEQALRILREMQKSLIKTVCGDWNHEAIQNFYLSKKETFCKSFASSFLTFQ